MICSQRGMYGSSESRHNPKAQCEHLFAVCELTLKTFFQNSQESLIFSITFRFPWTEPLITKEIAQKRRHLKRTGVSKTCYCTVNFWMAGNWIASPWCLLPCLTSCEATKQRSDPVTMHSEGSVPWGGQAGVPWVCSSAGWPPAHTVWNRCPQRLGQQIQFRLVPKWHQWLFLCPNVIV